MIEIDFVSWQADQPDIVCYLTPCNCLVMPAMIEATYILNIWDLETNTNRTIYINEAGYNKSLNGIQDKYPDPAETARPSTVILTPNDIASNGDWHTFEKGRVLKQDVLCLLTCSTLVTMAASKPTGVLLKLCSMQLKTNDMVRKTIHEIVFCTRP